MIISSLCLCLRSEVAYPLSQSSAFSVGCKFGKNVLSELGLLGTLLFVYM